MCPELGRSALDAVELMDVGVNYMREHMIDEARIHYAITDTGGDAPNVVQSRAQVLYAIRAPKITQVKELYNRVCNIARGAALMTETTVEIRQVAAYSNLISSKILADHMNAYLEKLGSITVQVLICHWLKDRFFHCICSFGAKVVPGNCGELIFVLI